MQTLHLDYETRSPADISLGSRVYADHPGTRVTCAVARLGDEESTWLSQRFDPEGVREQPWPWSAADPSTLTVWAYNVSFEQNIWRHVLRWPEPAAWRCTMALAAGNGLPGGLDKVAKYLGLPGKYEPGYKIMKKSCQPSKKDGTFYAPTEAEWAELLTYCRQDVEIECSIHAKLGELLPAEIATWQACNAINIRGVEIDRDLCTAALACTDALFSDVGEKVRLATGGAIDGAAGLRQLEKVVKPWLTEKGLACSKINAKWIKDTLAGDNPLAPDVRLVIEGRRDVSKISVAKLAAMLDRTTGFDHRLRHQLRYSAAHTGRWKSEGEQTWGGEEAGVQLQNLPKPQIEATPEAKAAALISGIPALPAIPEAIAAALASDIPALTALGDGDPSKSLVSLVRAAIIAKPGHTFIVADYSGIEARGALWLADDQEHLDWWRRYDAGTDKDPYCKMAEKTFGRPINKKDNPKERNVGKEQQLAGQYGCGAETLLNRCKIYGIDLTTLATGLGMPEESAALEVSQRLIDDYRAELSSLAAGWQKDPATGRFTPVGYWARLNNAGKLAVSYRESYDVGAVTFAPGKHGDLAVRLPSGRILRYWEPRLEPDPKYGNLGVVYRDVERNRDNRMYGGRWLENICQAVCRDLLADALVRCEATPGGALPVVFHVHDEIICEVPEATAEASLAQLIGIMETPPAWAKGFPVKAEGFISKRYRKG